MRYSLFKLSYNALGKRYELGKLGFSTLGILYRDCV